MIVNFIVNFLGAIALILVISVVLVVLYFFFFCLKEKIFMKKYSKIKTYEEANMTIFGVVPPAILEIPFGANIIINGSSDYSLYRQYKTRLYLKHIEQPNSATRVFNLCDVDKVVWEEYDIIYTLTRKGNTFVLTISKNNNSSDVSVYGMNGKKVS